MSADENAPDPKASSEAAQKRKADATAKEAIEEVRYDAEYLERNRRSLLNVNEPGVVAGALSSSDRKTHTLSEAQALVEEYIKRPVQLEGVGEES